MMVLERNILVCSIIRLSNISLNTAIELPWATFLKVCPLLHLFLLLCLLNVSLSSFHSSIKLKLALFREASMGNTRGHGCRRIFWPRKISRANYIFFRTWYLSVSTYSHKENLSQWVSQGSQKTWINRIIKSKVLLWLLPMLMQTPIGLGDNIVSVIT